MLRVRLLAWHKNNLIIYDFRIDDGSDEFFLHRTSVAELLTYLLGAIGAISVIGN